MNTLDDNDDESTPETPGNERGIKYEPIFLNPEKMLKEYHKSSGSNLYLKCKAAGQLELNITWYRNDEKLDDKDFENIKYTRWSLVIENAQIEDSGNYKCVICNNLGCIDHLFKVEITGKLD